MSRKRVCNICKDIISEGEKAFHNLGEFEGYRLKCQLCSNCNRIKEQYFKLSWSNQEEMFMFMYDDIFEHFITIGCESCEQQQECKLDYCDKVKCELARSAYLAM